MCSSDLPRVGPRRGHSRFALRRPAPAGCAPDGPWFRGSSLGDLLRLHGRREAVGQQADADGVARTFGVGAAEREQPLAEPLFEHRLLLAGAAATLLGVWLIWSYMKTADYAS